MEIKIVNNSGNELPTYETLGSAGMDLRAHIPSYVEIDPGESVLIPTGLHIAVPVGYEAQIRSRSGLTLKHGIVVANAPGTIDSDYTGDVGVILHNLGRRLYAVNPGDRIAQMVIAKYERAEWLPSIELDETDRGDGGFGSTGK